MKKTIKAFILIFTFMICVSLIGGAYALYVKNADNLEISFTAKLFGYTMTIFDSAGKEVETKQLADQGDGQYKAEYLADSGYTVKFYHDGELINYADDNASVVKGNNYPYYNRYTVYLKPDLQQKYIGEDTSYFLFLSTDHNLDANTRMRANPDNSNERMITGVKITAGTKFKIKQCKNYYNNLKGDLYNIPNFNSLYGFDDQYGDIVIKQTGTYDFYYDINNGLWINKVA